MVIYSEMNTIDKADVKHVAHLARISLDDNEVCGYCSQLASILSYINKLNELNTENVLPTSHAIPTLKNVFRKDVLRQSLDPEDALKNAPQREDGFFKVPQVIEGK